MALLPKATSIGLGIADSALGSHTFLLVSQAFLVGVGLLLLGSGDLALLLAAKSLSCVFSKSFKVGF